MGISNIPISLTLMDTHPYHAPVAFVKPLGCMNIRVSKYVDASGKIYLPYLQDWAHPNYDLSGLVQMCVNILSEQPIQPIYSQYIDLLSSHLLITTILNRGRR